MNKEIDASIIVCTFSSERKKFLELNIKSLKNQFFSGNYEVLIVVDRNNQLYQLLHTEYVDDSIVHIIENDGKGLTDGRNTGIQSSSGKIVIFLDDDAIPNNMWLHQMYKNYFDKKIIAVGGFTLPLWITPKDKWFPKELYWIFACTYKGHPERRSQVRNLMGCNMSFRRNVFRNIGLFKPILGRTDNYLMTADETEYCIRLSTMKPSAKIIFEPKARVFHLVPSYRISLRYVIRRAYNEGKSKALIRKIHTQVKISPNFSTESSYLKSLVLTSIPSYIRQTLSTKNMRKNVQVLGFLITVIFSTFFGYVLSYSNITQYKR
ncbi:MAG: glycosyltransferase family 2 protein [Candidatus Hodarchaeales archaeon]